MNISDIILHALAVLCHLFFLLVLLSPFSWWSNWGRPRKVKLWHLWSFLECTMECPVHAGNLTILQFLAVLFFKILLVFWEVLAALVQSWRWVGQMWLDPTLLQLMPGVSTLLPTEGFTPQWNSKQYHRTLLQEDRRGESDGQGNLPEILGEESGEATGGLRGSLGRGCLPLPAEAKRQLGGGELDSQAFPSDEPCPASAWPHFWGAAWVCFTGNWLKTQGQSLHQEVISKPGSYLVGAQSAKRGSIWIRVSQESRGSVLLASGAQDYAPGCYQNSPFSESALFLLFSL